MSARAGRCDGRRSASTSADERFFLVLCIGALAGAGDGARDASSSLSTRSRNSPATAPATALGAALAAVVCTSRVLRRRRGSGSAGGSGRTPSGAFEAICRCFLLAQPAYAGDFEISAYKLVDNDSRTIIRNTKLQGRTLPPALRGAGAFQPTRSVAEAFAIPTRSAAENR